MRRRHIRADHDEWVVIHRDPPPDNGCGCLVLLGFAFCLFPSLMHGPLGVLGLIILIGLIRSFMPRG